MEVLAERPTAIVRDSSVKLSVHAQGAKPVNMDPHSQEIWTNFKAALVFSLCISAVYLFYDLAHEFPQHLYDCPGQTTQDLLTQVEGSEHFMMAAYRDHRMDGSTRVLAVINTEEPMTLDCVFCCPGRGLQRSKGAVRKHRVHYGTKYIAGDVLCPKVSQCNATHVLLAIHHHDGHVVGGPFLTIQHQETREKDFPVFFTVCMNSVYGDYNNAIQFIQTMEVYKLLGVQKVVLYLTTCGQDFYKVLQHYVEEGTLEIVPWWSQVLRREIHLNGELSVLNECIYRNRYTSQYVLLANVDQLLIPYNHTSLRTLMEELQGKHPEASVFQVETHVFLLFDDGPRNASQSSGPEGRHMPGVDIFKQVYRVPFLEYDYRVHKLIINPRMVDQTASFEVTKSYGKTVDIPPEVCRMMEVEEPDDDTDKANLVLDNRLLDFAAHLARQMNNTIKKTL